MTIRKSAQPNQLERCGCAAFALRARHAANFETERNIFERRAPRKRRLFLKHHGDLLMRSGDARAVEQHCPSYSSINPPMMLNSVDLRIAGTDHGNKLAARDRKRHVIESGGLGGCPLVALADSGEREGHGRGGGHGGFVAVLHRDGERFSPGARSLRGDAQR